MAKGDHLIISFGPYQHHALDLGDGRIAQYGGGDFQNNRIEIIKLEALPAHREVKVVDEPARFAPDEIVERAFSRIGEDNYCLFSNNCEHFVNWCRAGRAQSQQISRAVKRTASITAKVLARRRHRVTARHAAKLFSKRATKSTTPWLLLADAAQLGTEVVASHRGLNAKSSEKAGQVVGVCTSAGIGAIAAGPVGAFFGVGFWAFGEAAGKMMVPPSNDQRGTE